MKRTFCLLVSLVVLTWISLPLQGQSLADLAKQEKDKREKQKVPKKVYTNEDLDKYQPLTSPTAPSTPDLSTSAAASTADSSTASGKESPERAWSKRFVEAKAKVQAAKTQQEVLQAKLNDLNMKLMNQSDVFDREHLYGPLITQTQEQIAKNKLEMAAAESALTDLREELRKSGNPASWENSQMALQPATEPGKLEAPKTKDQKYWQEQLSIIDKRYDEIIAPLNEERFQLVNRRVPKEGETAPSLSSTSLGLPPRVVDIDVQIKELNQKRQQEKNALIEEAVRQGALPGWFR